MRQNGPGLGIRALELFVETYPNSVWTPSLRNNLAFYYRNKGRYSLALAHWENAWETTKLADLGNAKAVADFALAHYTRLLASLGRKETLTAIFQGTNGQVLDAGPLQQVFEATREGYVTMLNDPGLAYRCGTLALSHVARILQPGSTNAWKPMYVPSPVTGFSMSALQDLANQYQLNLVAVQRLSGQALVVPAVVHWKLDHYAALTAYDGKRYKVEDPTFERAIWMDADTINAEASGYFLVPATMVLPGWGALTRAQTDQIYGRGFPFNADDGNCESCPTDEDGDDEADDTNPSANADAGDPQPSDPTCNGSGGPPDPCCSDCGSGADAGMPAWKVVEPTLNLWFLDKPTFYTKSYGRRHVFKLMYKQRNTPVNSYGFGFGSFWECNRLGYFQRDSSSNLTHFVPGGGLRTYTDGVAEYKSHALASTTTDGSGGVASVGVRFPNASTNTYDYVFDHFDGTRDIYLSQQVNRYGRTNKFNYTNVNSKVHLVSVRDHDNRLTSFSYTNASFPDLVTVVTDPYGRTVALKYDSSGRLTNIVDAAGISSSFVYDDNTGWVTNLVTPYGTTIFKITGATSNYTNDTEYAVNRSVTVTEPNGSKQLFIYRRDAGQLNDNDTTALIPQFWPSSDIPSLPYNNTLSSDYTHLHNSFHWNRQQYSTLSSTFQSSGDFNDLNRGRL
jgi:YD repeat-containing protein